MQCDELISTYLKVLGEGANCKILPNGRLSVVFPFLYPDHDNVEIFVKDAGEEVTVSDLGETLRRLDTIGMDIYGSGKFAYQAERIASGFEVHIENGVLLKSGPRQNVGGVLFDVLSVCMAIGDLAYGSRGYQPLTFYDEVEKLLAINEYDFEKHHLIKGGSTTEYRIDFQVKTRQRVSLVQTLGAKTESGIKKWVNATFRMWNDVETGEEKVVRKVSLLNDEISKIRQEDINILSNVSTVFLWTHQEEFMSSLQNGNGSVH
jgi:hypothetical protein